MSDVTFMAGICVKLLTNSQTRYNYEDKKPTEVLASHLILSILQSHYLLFMSVDLNSFKGADLGVFSPNAY